LKGGKMDLKTYSIKEKNQKEFNRLKKLEGKCELIIEKDC